MKNILYTVFLCVVLFSCEKDITVNVPNESKKIVVQGFVEPHQPIIVKLSYSTGYFDSVDTNFLINNEIKGAKVTVFDGIKTINLSETFYFGHSAYVSLDTAFAKYGSTYLLNVQVGNQSLYGKTTIPKPIPLDSVLVRFHGKGDSLGYIYGHLSDPDTLGNHYRALTMRVGKDADFYSSFGVIEDKLFNGKSFRLQIRRGIAPNSLKKEDLNGESGSFKLGDSVVLKWTTIDKEHYEFWRTLNLNARANGNPFASPTTIKTNIVGGLGIWGGYASVIYRLRFK